jgi:hypothetical protein
MIRGNIPDRGEQGTNFLGHPIEHGKFQDIESFIPFSLSDACHSPQSGFQE